MKTIIEMALEADIDAEAEGLTQALERFAALVREDEREKIALAHRIRPRGKSVASQMIAEREKQDHLANAGKAIEQEPVAGSDDDTDKAAELGWYLQAQIDAAVLAEREACAKVCEEIDDASYPHTRLWPSDCAAAIRARGEE